MLRRTRILRSVQFIPINSATIGHFVLDTEKILLNLKSIVSDQNANLFPIFVLETRISNDFFVKILKSLGYWVVPNFPFAAIHGLLRKVYPKYRWRTARVMEKSELLVAHIQNTPRLYNLSPSENEIGYDFLDTIGFSRNDKIVCCVFRDFGYDIAMMDMNFLDKQGYRITPLDQFESVVNLLIERGFKVVRLGRHNSEKLNINSRSYVDVSDHRSPSNALLDFFLVSTCEFVLSTGSGIDALSTFFRKPTCFLNITYAHKIPNAPLWPVILLSDYVCKETGEKVPLEAVLSDELTNTWHGNLSTRGISIKPKDENKLLEALEIFLCKLSIQAESRTEKCSGSLLNVGNIYY